MKIIIAPYAAALRNGSPNPKNWGYFPELVADLKRAGYEVIQIGVQGEQRINGVDQFIIGWPFRKLRELFNDADCWVSVDSVIPHFCYCERLKPGVVIFTQSDPVVWGHSRNINLLRDRKYLRQFQYDSWESCEYNPQAFVTPDKVVHAVYELAPMLSNEIPLLMLEPLNA